MPKLSLNVNILSLLADNHIKSEAKQTVPSTLPAYFLLKQLQHINKICETEISTNQMLSFLCVKYFSLMKGETCCMR